MELLYLLEKIRLPVLDELMLLVTMLGEETAFLLVALVVFWCVDKRRGYLVMAVGFVGIITNQILKLICRVPRPWVLDQSFPVVEGAKEAAGGYSFPSGHTSMAVGTFGALAVTSKNRWMKVSYVTLAVLVTFSRMYLGVHTLADVLGGAICAIVLIVLLRPVVMGDNEKLMDPLVTGMLALGAFFLACVELAPITKGVDPSVLHSAMKNAYTMAGCLAAVFVVYHAERKWVQFSVEGVWWIQIIKVVLGIALVLLVKSGTKAPLEAVFAGHLAARAVRYFLVVLTAGLLWPMTFRWWRSLAVLCRK